MYNLNGGYDVLNEDESYAVNKVNDRKFIVSKEDGTSYTLEQKQSRWSCTCTGYKYRGKCFAPGTLICTVEGLKPIEDIVVGSGSGEWRPLLYQG